MEELVKKLQSFSFVATVAVVFGMMSLSSVMHAQQSQDPAPQSQQPSTQQPTNPTQPPDSQAPPPTQQAPSQGQSSAQSGDSSNSQVFVGTVTKQGDKYVFQDSASGSTYDIDHQDEVKNFEGKKVRVHGTLDPATKTIHVQ
jgi:uncharacterized protein YdeI (BOF family)